MAYTLTDPFRSLKSILRVSGFVDGALGAALLLAPRSWVTGWAVAAAGPFWPVRLAGAALLTLGIFYLLSATQRVPGIPTMVAAALGNALIAGVILAGYLQQDFAGLPPLGLVLLIAVFVVCLIGAVTPLRYLRAEYRAE